MKKLLYFILWIILFLSFTNRTFAVYDPLSVKNNIFGIHILFPEEVREASVLVNSSGGNWGYVTIPIEATDRNLEKWQKFMDDCRKYHLIPIIRLATNNDYFNNGSWSTPSDYDVLDFANFLNSLNWPTKNRYVVVFNEPNRGDEWGGTPDASGYAQILDYAVKIFKQRSPDFFVISAGLDNASANIEGQSIDEYTFMNEMNNAVPGIFNEIDGLGSHSYPNPGFSAAPSQAMEGVDSFYYQNNIVYELTGKKLPVFITETGWSSNTVPYDIQDKYYSQTLDNFWNDKNIVAITPFLFHAEQGDFTQFSFIRNGADTTLYKYYQLIPKIKGDPLLTNYPFPQNTLPNLSYPTIKFKSNNPINSIFNTINKSSKSFFKWLLNV